MTLDQIATDELQVLYRQALVDLATMEDEGLTPTDQRYFDAAGELGLVEAELNRRAH
jgi:hypothetical protein